VPTKGEAQLAEQRVPNLEEMTEQEAHRFLMELFSNLSAEAEYELRHQDYVMEMPQSGESIRGREKMREFQEAYPTPPSIQVRRVLVRGGCGSLRGSTTMVAGRYSTWCYSWSLKTGRCGGTDATTPSRSRHRSGERSG
jgi:hypothetical protein